MDAVFKLDTSVLTEVLERVGQRPSGVVVFDLDSTLLDNRPRQAQILREFGAARGLPLLLQAAPSHWEDWNIRRAMRNAGLSTDDVARHADAAKDFWRERFFTSAYCELDEMIPGAAPFVQKVFACGAQIAYCTGRHEPMRPGTVNCLARLGFPVPPSRVELLMKPTFEQSDDDWKVVAIERLGQLGEVLALFDNEPTHANGYRQSFPDAAIVHLATDHSGREVALLDGIRSIHNFL